MAMAMARASGSAPTPASPSLYERVKAEVYRKMPRHSAYRSGHVVKQYKAAFARRFGSKRSPYKEEGKARSRGRTRGKSKRSKSKRSKRSKRSERSNRGRRTRRRARGRSRGLTRWFAEKWRNQRGKVGYRYKSDVYRPTVRVTRRTPLTHGELTRREVRRARRTKARRGRVGRFRPTKRSKRRKR